MLLLVWARGGWGYCCEHAYGEVVGTKRHRETNQEYARSEGSHGLAGEGIEKDEPEDAADPLRARRRGLAPQPDLWSR